MIHPTFLSAYLFNPHPFSQHFRDDDAAVGLLLVFEEGDHGSRDRDGGAVERVDEVRPLLVRQLAADAEPARLKIGAVRGGGDLAPLARFAAAGHPGFEVEFSVGRPAQVAAGDVEHSVRNAQALEDVFLDAQDQFVELVGLGEVRRGEAEHLDLRELMHAVDPLRRLAVSTRLGAEAVRDAGVLQRQLFDVEDVILQHAAERDLGRRDEAEVGPCDRINLRLRAARLVAGSLQHVHASEVGRRVQREPRVS